MTSSNIVDVSRNNGHTNKDHEKTPEEIQLEIARTKTAITEDLLALSEKLSPQHLREGAREVMRDAREEVKEVIKETKDAALDSLRGVKDRAIHSVNETVSEIGTRARHAGSLTVDFVSANAVAVSLLGLGAGWLVWALRHRRQQGADYAYQYEHYSAPAESYDRGIEGERSEGQGTLARAQDAVRGVASRASRAVDAAREQVRSRASHLGSDAGRLTERAGASARRMANQTTRVAGDNRMAVIGLTIAAGLGLGLLLPVGRAPRRALRRAGERAWNEAGQLAQNMGMQRNRSSHAVDPFDMADLSRMPSGTAY